VPDASPSPERVRAALEELLGWQGIARSPQLAELLRYVVERTLNGDGAAIKAYSIAVDVFGRPAEFDPQSDPIVRVQARRLRTLLEQFYAGGSSSTDVQIHLPLGRYVPEFQSVERTAAATQPAAPRAAPEPSPRFTAADRAGETPSRFLQNAAIGLLFTLVGVGLTVAVINWILPLQPRVVPLIPDVPHITIGSFDNLTGQRLLDDDVGEVAVRVGDALQRYEDLVVGGDGLVLTGTIQTVNEHFVLRAMLTDPATNSAVWTSTINAPTAVTDTTALTASGDVLASQLGHSSGPLHAKARAWLELQGALPEQPSPYLCYLLYMKWRDIRTVVDAEKGAACFDRVLAASPDNAMAIAAAAGMKAWRIQFLATPADELSAMMADETAAAGRAVTLRPDSSFVYEQQATVLARQGSIDAAIGAIEKAYKLNPTSMDALSVKALLYWIDGQIDAAVSFSEQSIAALPSPPARYYTVRAFNALKQQRFFDAIDAAQALATGDEEFGPVVALAAAPRAGRQDLIDRYRPMVMANPHYQVAGILPRLAMRVRAESIFELLREGLVLAGVPPSALEGPFNPDGTAVAR
jgi:tetratricopeptide (TPR) repeat protein